jgi:hypothetical protein
MEVRKMAEKRYTYTTKIKQPQTVAGVKLDPKGGALSEREYKILKKDAYGASLLEKELLVVKEAPGPDQTQGNDANRPDLPAQAPDMTQGDGVGETVPDIETGDEKKGRKK